MRKWGIVVTAFYGLIVLAFLAPLVMILAKSTALTPADFKETYANWFIWICLAILLAGQGLLLWLSVDTSKKRLKPRTHVLVTSALASMFVMILTVGIFGCLLVAVWGDGPPDWIRWPLLCTLASWIVWGILFYRLWRNSGDQVTRAVAWLFRGSVLELLVAVPAHVIVRRRHDCCAPGVTAFGIASGIAIMLLSFGPGVLLLFKKRMERYGNGSSAAREV